MQERKKKWLFKYGDNSMVRKKISEVNLQTNRSDNMYEGYICMREWGVAPMVENIETPCNTCVRIKDINKRTKNMANGKTNRCNSHYKLALKMDNAIYLSLDNDYFRSSY